MGVARLLVLASQVPTPLNIRSTNVSSRPCYPHDPAAFTQGSSIHRRGVYEGTGPQRALVDPQGQTRTGEVLQKYDLTAEYFGEGITSGRTI